MKWVRRGLVALGIFIIGYGAFGVLTDASIAKFPYLRYLAAVLFGHDLLVLPLVIVIAAVTLRYLPDVVRPVVQAALFVTIALTVVALPLVLGYGHKPDMPSALPRDYPRGLLITLGAVWLTTAAVLMVQLVQRRAVMSAQQATGAPSGVRSAGPSNEGPGADVRGADVPPAERPLKGKEQ